MQRKGNLALPTKEEIIEKNPQLDLAVIDEYEIVKQKLNEVVPSKAPSYDISSPFSGADVSQPSIAHVAVPSKK